MANKKVKCKVCGNEYTVRGITRHIKSCKAIQEKYSKGIYKYYTLKIKDAYSSSFFLYVSAVSHLTLEELDQFLRDIWVECCGHLSCFNYNGKTYNIDDQSSFGVDGRNIQLKQLLKIGETLSYEYDYGSTTELEIEVIDQLSGDFRESLIEIFARNELPDYFVENEDFPEPSNSPRIGVCGYDGPLEQFEDPVSWGKNKKKVKPMKKSKKMKRLIELTNDYIKCRPFEVFPSDLLLAIEDPETAMVYYCSILGYDLQELALNVHVGNYGLAGFFQMAMAPDAPDLFQNLNFISLMFDAPDILEPKDLEIVETYEPLALYDMYPFFKKSYRGEIFSDLENKEIDIMILVLERILEIYHQYQNKVDEMMAHKNKGELFKTFYEDGKWHYIYTEEMPTFDSLQYNELDVKRIQKKSQVSMNKWELTSIFLPTLTMDDYFPEVIVLQDKMSGLILNEIVVEGKKDSTTDAKSLIDQTIQQTKVIPMEITTDKKFYFDSLKDYLKKLGTKIYHEGLSEEMIDFRDGIYQGEDQLMAEEILEGLPEELIEKLMQGELNPEDLDEKTMLEIIEQLGLDFF